MPRPYKPEKRSEARRLRSEGTPYKRIAAALGVSPATAHSWTRDIQLTPEQVHCNLYGPGGPQSPELISKRVATWIERNRERRRRHQQEGRQRAQRDDPLHLAGCMLYWAEGSKERNAIQFANSDPHMSRYFRRFLKESLGVSDEEIAVALNVHLTNGLLLHEIEEHWLSLLDLPRSSLRKHTLNNLPTSSSGKQRHKLPYGVCTLKVNRTDLVQHIYGAIQEYAGFEQPLWLDGRMRRGRRRAATARAA